MAKERILLVATTSFIGLNADGSSFHARAGETIVWSDHPAVATYSEWFRPVSATYETPRIEQATAAPGEKRGA
jgi:hypothetical protein